MDEEFYKKLLNYLVREIDGLWYRTYSPSRYCGFDENITLYSWGYNSQLFGENDIEDQYNLESYREVAEAITQYLKIVK